MASRGTGPLTAKSAAGSPAGPEALADAVMLQAVAERILASGSFRRSPRLREMLGFVVQCTREGREHELNEYSIGVQVFGKPKDYSPSQDNIVRVTARQLRIKLAEYYAGEGKDEPWRLEVARGGYVPQLVAAGSAEEPAAEAARVPAWVRWALVGLALAAVSGWVVSSWLLVSGRQQSAAVNRHLLEGLVGERSVPTTIVLDDPLLPRLWEFTGKNISLEDLLQNRYLNAESYQGSGGEETRRLAESMHVTSSESMRVVGHIYRLAGAAGQQVYVQHCRNMQANELARGNLIFLGGVGANPWGYLLQKNLNFEQVIRPRVSRTFLNLKPKPGEPAEFEVSAQSPTGPTRYARVAVFRNPLGSGRVALVGGTSKESSETAGEFALSEAAYEQVKRLCGTASIRELDSFELILKSSTVGGASLSTHIVAHRCNGR